MSWSRRSHQCRKRNATTDALYTFKHALMQDAAYYSVLKSRRQELHAEDRPRD